MCLMREQCKAGSRDNSVNGFRGVLHPLGALIPSQHQRRSGDFCEFRQGVRIPTHCIRYIRYNSSVIGKCVSYRKQRLPLRRLSHRFRIVSWKSYSFRCNLWRDGSIYVAKIDLNWNLASRYIDGSFCLIRSLAWMEWAIFSQMLVAKASAIYVGVTESGALSTISLCA